MSERRRGKMLEALDALGKWSLIDNYVLVMMMVAFHFHIQNQVTWPWLVMIPDDFLLVEVTVQPGYGIFGFIIFLSWRIPSKPPSEAVRLCACTVYGPPPSLPPSWWTESPPPKGR